MSEIKKICLIGAGNLATHLCKVIHKKEFSISQIFSRTLLNAQKLSDKYDAEAIDDLSNMNSEADLYLICVKDDAITTISEALSSIQSLKQKLIVHTSGFTSSTVLSSFDNYGVFWPLQSFSKKDKIKFKKIPICITANTKDNEDSLSNFAEALSKNVHRVSDEQRAYLHISAVFANNFSNRMFSIAYELAEKHGLNHELLIPIINKTIKNAISNHPKDTQTGPARRNDHKVLKAQMELLADEKDFLELYELISKNITEAYKDEN